MLNLKERTIVVCLYQDNSAYKHNSHNRPAGYMLEAEMSDNKREIRYYGIEDKGTTSEDCFRLATPIEIRAYEKAIRFIKDIPKNEIINEYSIY